MAELWRNTTTTPQSSGGVPVLAFVIKNTLGHAKGNIPCGSVTSKTILCFPLTLLNHSSASEISGDTQCSAAEIIEGLAIIPAPNTVMPDKNFFKNPRR